ncbi:hypothetical protein IR148_16225 [Dysgonomonas mossii]|uniref:Uncharacterized protein n=1 Tax=Dysgonomonas mossii TaxID=163665 RepID=A0A4Y9IJP6_9BACT|nr:hypothetical protein [Dysgonomonas mossii]MBF0762586.1 hypothetical protein [Dysgonomonas mossii]TFU86989.1 hypothetical protein E4T88_16200 [Dysgonomonas mossii]
MRLYFVFTILFVSQLIHSQVKIEGKLSFDFSFMNDQQFIDSIPNFPNDLYEYYNVRITRDLDFGLKESILGLVSSFHKGNIGLSKYKMSDIHLLTKNDSVIAIIGEIPNYKTSIYFNKIEVNKYIRKHDSFYQTKTTVNDLRNDLLKDEYYGYICGEAPVIYEIPQYNGLSFDNLKNINQFRYWLRSYNPELQTYGVDALSYLYKKKYSDKNDEKVKQDRSIIKYIKQRNSILNTCSGCFVGIYERVF